MQSPRSSQSVSPRGNRRWRYAAAGTAAALALFLSAAPSVYAQTFKSLYSFQGNPDGASPAGALAEDSSGNIYGTTYSGGAGQGTVFMINSAGQESLCHTFAGNPDGAFPNGGLITNPAGSTLYGTTQSGGSINAGSVFQLALPCSGADTVLYNFNYSVDGYFPLAGVILGASGDLYGTTEGGGTLGNGTVFAIDPAKQFDVPPFPVALSDGMNPNAGLVQDQNGNLYGDTTMGGTNGLGTIFEVNPSGQITTLYSFTGQSDGAYPYGTLVIDSKGNLYGTTNDGGANGLGVVFEYSPSSPGQVTALHAFAGVANGDGANSIAGLVMDSAGNLYGVTQVGGTACANSSNGCGTIFEIDASGNYSVLHSFNGTDGYLPYANLILDAKTNLLYGTTNQGGAANLGTVFKYALPSAIPALTVTAKFAANSSGFQLQAFVTQSGGPAINPSTQGMTLAVGSPQIYSVTIPASSFNTANKGWYTFNGSINGVSLQCRVSQQGANIYEVQVQASGVNVTSQHNPPITLTFGPNTGTTQANQPATISTTQKKPKH
ncbi:MAG TPA: choice-of-anchor tandem repeat GloVer-containing protein [Terracidiphilus sp.]|nr:choice-of-anchor tandem repeat GloVer-containing protein [Terracidiphilus sp.]